MCVCMCVAFFATSFSFVYSLILVFLRALLSFFFSLHFLPPGVLIHFYVFVKHLYLDSSQYFSPELQTYIFVCWRSSLRCLTGTQTMYVWNWTHQLSPQENMVICVILFPSYFSKKNYSYSKSETHRLVLPSLLSQIFSWYLTPADFRPQCLSDLSDPFHPALLQPRPDYCLKTDQARCSGSLL